MAAHSKNQRRAASVLALVACLLLSSCASRPVKLSGGLGPSASIELGKEQQTGDVDLSIHAGADVGYSLEIHRNKSAPNVSIQTVDSTPTESPAPHSTSGK